MKKSLQIISGLKLGQIIEAKVTKLGDFATEVTLSRQYINKVIKKKKVRIEVDKLAKIKNYLNITLEEIKYDPRETESKQKGTPGRYPVSSSILEELEVCRKDLAHWRGLAQEYENELNKLRGQQK